MNREPLRVTFFVEWLSRRGGGVSEMARQLAVELSSRPGITVAAVGLEDEFLGEDLARWAPVKIVACSIRGPRALGYSPKVQAAIAGTKPDVVHIHNSWYLAVAAAASAARKASVPYVLTVHGSFEKWALDVARLKKAIASRAYYARVVKDASYLHVLTQAEEASVRKFGATAPVAVIPNGVTLPAAIHSLSATDGRRRLLYVGRLHPIKNLPSLIRAWSAVADLARGSGWSLEIAGWSQVGHHAELERLVGELGLGDTIAIRGPAFGEDKDRLLRSANAFILPSFSEGQPLAALEAMAYGLPVVMTPECNLREPLRIGAAIEVGTAPESIAAGLSNLFGMTDAARQSAGTVARAYVEQSLTWAPIADRIIAMYRDAIARNRNNGAPLVCPG